MSDIREHGVRGHAMIEFVIIAPVLFAFAINIYDLGNALWHHSSLTQVVREIVREASSTPGLEQGVYTLREQGGVSDDCSYDSMLEPINYPDGTPHKCTCTPAPCPVNVKLVLQKNYGVLSLWEGREGLSLKQFSREITLDVQYVGGFPQNVVGTVKASYLGLFNGALSYFIFPFGDFPVAASHTAGYL